MKRYFIHNPVFRLVAPAVYGVLIYLLVLLINNDVTQVNDLFINQEVYVCIILTYLSFESNRLIIVIFNRVIPKKTFIPATLLQVVATTLVSVTLVIVCLQSYFNFVEGFSIGSTQLWIFTFIFIATSLIYNVLYYSNYYLQKENTIKLNSEKQNRQVLELEMLEFKNDINPDLLYESLESLIGVMYRDVEKAEDYIDCLASTYRYVLANRQKELISVSEELNAARNLVKLLNEKYHGQLRFQSSLNEKEMQGLLIPGSLPRVIESLVRNTIITRYEPFVIECFTEDEYLTIQSKLNDKLLLHEASDQTINRLQKSYSLYCDLPLIRVKAYDENYIKLPLIRLAEEFETTR
jgi:sensor histidine kinase YesM